MANKVNKTCEKSGFWFRQTGITPSNDELADIDKNLCGFITILREWAESKKIKRIGGKNVHQRCFEGAPNG